MAAASFFGRILAKFIPKETIHMTHPIRGVTGLRLRIGPVSIRAAKAESIC